MRTLRYRHDVFNKIHIKGPHHPYESMRSWVTAYFMGPQGRVLIGPGSSTDSYLFTLIRFSSLSLPFNDLNPETAFRSTRHSAVHLFFTSAHSWRVNAGLSAAAGFLDTRPPNFVKWVSTS